MSKYQFGSRWTRSERILLNLLGLSVEEIEKRIQDLAVEGQLTPAQVAEMYAVFNGFLKSGAVTLDDLDKNSIKFDETWMAESLLQAIAGTANIHAVPADGGVTRSKLANSAVDRSKLADRYTYVGSVLSGNGLYSATKEGIYRVAANGNHPDFPSFLDPSRNAVIRVTPINYSGSLIFQDMYQENDVSIHVARLVNTSTPGGGSWKIIGRPSEQQLLLAENSIPNFDKFGNTSQPISSDLIKQQYSAIKNIKIIGLDQDIPVRIWMLCKDFGSWNDRIIIAKKESDNWQTLIDTGLNFVADKNPNGPTDITYASGSIRQEMRVDYNQIETGGRLIDGSSLDVDPQYIVNPANIMLVENAGGGGGEAYDQSLNTTDDVKFASVEVGGELPTGTISEPPAGLLAGDMWLDTTDSTEYPILRVMT